MLVSVNDRVTFISRCSLLLAYGHCAWTWTGMYFSPRRYCSALQPTPEWSPSVWRRCITHMKQELWRCRTPINRKAANFIPQHTCRPYVARSRSSKSASAVSRTLGLCRPPWYYLHYKATTEGDRA